VFVVNQPPSGGVKENYSFLVWYSVSVDFYFRFLILRTDCCIAWLR